MNKISQRHTADIARRAADFIQTGKGGAKRAARRHFPVLRLSMACAAHLVAIGLFRIDSDSAGKSG
jgi:hypothetical protein